MNYSDLKKNIYAYLGFRGTGESAETDALIGQCLSELKQTESFRYRYKTYETPPAFLRKEPYLSYLSGSRGAVLSVMTLGAEVDRKIKFYERTDMAKSVVFDACASAWLEARADEYEAGIGELGYRFCPGYGGSDVKDVLEIFALIQPEKIGVTLFDGHYMLPSKSMAGILAVGGKKEKNCGNCFLLPHCKYRQEGTRCYGSEKK